MVISAESAPLIKISYAIKELPDDKFKISSSFCSLIYWLEKHFNIRRRCCRNGEEKSEIWLNVRDYFNRF